MRTLKASTPGFKLRPATVPDYGPAMKYAPLTAEAVIWQRTPVLVAQRYKQAASVQAEVKKRIRDLPIADPGYGYVYWHPQKHSLWAVLSDSDETETYDQWQKALEGIPGVDKVIMEAEVGPPRESREDWIHIKRANVMRAINKPYEWAGKLTGGPSPLSNAVVSSLLGGGMGYAAGTAAEKLLPSSQFEEGKLRKSMARLGAFGGAALHAPQWLANAAVNRHSTGKSHWLRSLALGDKYQHLAPHENALRNNLHATGPLSGHEKQFAAARAGLAGLPELPEDYTKQAAKFVKAAYGSGFGGSESVALRPVPVDAFNRAIWNDVHNGRRSSQSNPYGTRSPFGGNDTPFTSPPEAAAATGIVEGVRQMYGGRSMLSPAHFIRGLAAAGVDGATATVAGGVLGVLGGLKPEAQKSLQRAGIWGGLIRGVTGSLLGM